MQRTSEISEVKFQSKISFRGLVTIKTKMDHIFFNTTNDKTNSNVQRPKNIFINNIFFTYLKVLLRCLRSSGMLWFQIFSIIISCLSYSELLLLLLLVLKEGNEK